MKQQSDEKTQFNMFKKLVGDIEEDQLKYVEYYACDNIAICIPSTGFSGESIKESHSHPSYSCVICFSEEANIVSSDLRITPNHCLAFITPPNFSHEEGQKDVFSRHAIIFIKKDYFEERYVFYCGQAPFDGLSKAFLIASNFMQLISKFIKEISADMPGKENVLDALTELIVQRLIRSVFEIDTGVSVLNENTRMYRVIAYLNQNYDKKINVAFLAKMSGFSEAYFMRRFKKETGCTLMDFLEKIRMHNAKNMLRSSDKSISEIALMCGFNNCAHFSARFSKVIGITPSAYKSMFY